MVSSRDRRGVYIAERRLGRHRRAECRLMPDDLLCTLAHQRRRSDTVVAVGLCDAGDHRRGVRCEPTEFPVQFENADRGGALPPHQTVVMPANEASLLARERPFSH